MPRHSTTELSRQEQRVLEFYAQGLSRKEIAQALAISLGTVNDYSANLYRKLGVHSCAAAVTWYWENQKGSVSRKNTVD